MIDKTEYEALDGVGLAEEIRRGKFTATEVMDLAISKAEALNPVINAISWQTFEFARQQAREFDNAKDKVDSPLAGVPFLYKDISAVKGLPQTCHSRLFSVETADHDGAIIKRFKQAGLLSLGKTNTPELCLTITTESVFGGPCRNPWHLDHSVGGSSGGSAAAVAARIVPLAHATDGGGSIRVPAACCGLVGLKPSRGLTPVESRQDANWSGLSVGHVVSRTVRDSAAILDAIRLSEQGLYPLPIAPDSFSNDLQKSPTLRIGIQREHPLGAQVHPEVAKSLDITSDLCRQLGYSVIDTKPPVDYRFLAACGGKIINTHVAQKIMPQLEKCGLNLDTELLEEGTRRMAKRGSETSAIEYLDAVDGINEIARQMSVFHQDVDILISPVTTQPPAPLGWLDMNSDDMKTYVSRFNSYSGFCSLFNATGQPSISLPIYQSQNGLPIGVMFSARWGADLALLQLAYRLEQEVNWEQRRPPLL